MMRKLSVPLQGKMLGQSVFEYSYKRKDMVVNMSMKTVECEGQKKLQKILAIAFPGALSNC